MWRRIHNHHFPRLFLLINIVVVLFQLKKSMNGIFLTTTRQEASLDHSVITPTRSNIKLSFQLPSQHHHRELGRRGGELPARVSDNKTKKTKAENKTSNVKLSFQLPKITATDATTSSKTTSQQSTSTERITGSTTDNNHEPSQKPLNIVILYPDDWRHDTLGGVAPVVRTPFLNQLAQEGVRFTHNCVTTSICWVSRATLFTGQYVSRHKSYKLRTPEFYQTWHNQSWPALLQQRKGYHVGHVGKWQYSNPDNIVQSLFNYTSIFEGKHQYPHNGGVMGAAEKTAVEVRKFLETRPKDAPFAVTAAFYPPKAIGNSFAPGGQWFPLNSSRALYDNVTIPRPYDEKKAYKKLPWFFDKLERGGRSRWEERFQTDEQYQAAMKNYYSLVTEVDTACQDIYQALEEQGLRNNTLIIFTTDNGLFHAEHGLAGKWYPYQESIRVPLIIKDPRMTVQKHGTLDDSLTLNVDLHPTILGAAGIEAPPLTQGRDIADIYLDEAGKNMGKTGDTQAATISHQEPWRSEFFYEFPLDMGKTMPMSSAVVRHDLKYIYWPQFKHEQLFNLTEDPLELNDVVGDPSYADTLTTLRLRHDEMMKAVQ